jgi:hypothetical protein
MECAVKDETVLLVRRPDESGRATVDMGSDSQDARRLAMLLIRAEKVPAQWAEPRNNDVEMHGRARVPL